MIQEEPFHPGFSLKTYTQYGERATLDSAVCVVWACGANVRGHIGFITAICGYRWDGLDRAPDCRICRQGNRRPRVFGGFVFFGGGEGTGMGGRGPLGAGLGMPSFPQTGCGRSGKFRHTRVRGAAMANPWRKQANIFCCALLDTDPTMSMT